MPGHPEAKADWVHRDPQDVIDEFDAELEVSDEDLEQMDKRKFKAWMKHMVDGIACLANQSLEAKAQADMETSKSRSELNSDDLLRQERESRQERKDRIKKWHKSWHTEDVQALMIQDVQFRPEYKANFGYLANHFLSLDWFLVSAGPQTSVIYRANESSSSRTRVKSFSRTSRSRTRFAKVGAQRRGTENNDEGRIS